MNPKCYLLIFSRRCSNGLENKTFDDIYTTYVNSMNQSQNWLYKKTL